MMINIIGEFFGSSGYANHTRYLANELNKLIPCKVVTNIPQGFERDVNDQELEMLKREQDSEINLIITHPLYWRTNCSAKRNFVYLIWEGDKIPEWIYRECNNPAIEKIIVPSQHTYDAAMNTDSNYKVDVPFKDKFIIIPHGVDLETFYPINSQRKKDKDDGSNDTLSGDTKQSEGQKIKDEQMPSSVDNHADKFTFLSVKGLRNLEDRGGAQYLIKAYLEEFNGENTELIIKINPAYGIPNIEQLFPEIKERTDIKFITDNYTNKQLNELYNQCDVYVSPTRAEAFNLPCLEAMACGKPVITTNYGGQTDYIKDGFHGALINYDLTEVEHELEFEGIKWATPNHEDLKKSMRYFYDSDVCGILGSQAQESVKELTWKNTAKHLNSLIN